MYNKPPLSPPIIHSTPKFSQMDRLVRANVRHLEIDFRPSDRSSSARFTITNLMHTMSVAVHLTPTRPAVYSLSPVTPSLLPPLSSATFSLTLTSPSSSSAHPPVSSPPDSLLVRSVVVPTANSDPASLLRRFAHPSGPHVFKDADLPIFLVGPHVLDHLLLLSSQTLVPTSQISVAASACTGSDMSAILRRSAAAGNPRFVSELLSSGADPNTRGALSLAVSSGSLPCVDILLAAGSTVSLRHEEDVFHVSAAANRTDIISSLAKSVGPAWRDSVDRVGRTPLHYAAANGHLDAVRMCIGNADRADSAGWTPLHCAAAGGFFNVVEVLITASKYNAKLSLTAEGRKTALDVAAENKHSHLYDILGLGDDLMRAASAGNVDAVRRCLMLGADVDQKDQNGWTALHRAAFKGRTEVVEFLIDNGADLDAVDDVGFTALRCAAEAGRTVAMMVLIDRGARKRGLKKGVDLFSLKGSDFGGKEFVVPLFCVEIGKNLGLL